MRDRLSNHCLYAHLLLGVTQARGGLGSGRDGLLDLVDDLARRVDGVRRHRDGSGPPLDELLRDVRVVCGRLAAEADRLVVLARRLDDVLDGHQDRRVRLVVVLGELVVVAIDTEHRLGEVVGADAHAVHVHEEVLELEDVDRQLRHHPQLEPVHAALQTTIGQELSSPLHLGDGANERDHHVQVREELPHAPVGLHLHGENLRELLAPEDAAQTEHRVLLVDGLVELAELEAHHLVLLEVGGPDDDVPALERLAEDGQRVGQCRDECLLEAVVDKPLGVDADAAKQLLEPDESDAVHVLPSHTHRLGRLGEGRHDLGAGLDVRHLGLLGGESLLAQGLPCQAGLGDTLEHLTVAGIDRDDLTVLQHIEHRFGTDDAGDPDLTAGDGRVAELAATPGDHRPSLVERRVVVRARHVGDEDVPLLDLVAVLRTVEDHDATADHAGRCQRTGDEHQSGLLLGERDVRDAPRGLDRCWPGLENDELVVHEPPLDVHRFAVVRLDALADLGELPDLCDRQLVALAEAGRDLDLDVALHAGRIAYQHDLLVVPRPLDLAGLLADDVAVGRQVATDNQFAEAVDGIDAQIVWVARRILREHHAGDVALRHQLHRDREADLLVRELLPHTVLD